MAGGVAGVTVSRPPGGAVLTLAWVGVIGAGFALPRDAGQRPAPSRPRALSQSAAVPLPGAVSVSRPPGLGGGAVLTLAWVGVIGAGFALPRDAGQRPALQAVPALFRNRRTAICVPLPGAVSVSRPPGLGGGAVLTLAWVGVIGAGFALPRDAGQRPALQAVPALFHNRRTAICVPLPGAVSVSRPPGLGGGAVLTLAWVGVIGAGFALPRDAGQRPALQAVPALFHNRRNARFASRYPGRCRCRALRDWEVVRSGLGGGPVLTLAWVGVIGAGFALPRDAGQRPALQAVPALFHNRRTAICVPLPGAVSVSRPPGLGGGAVLTLAWVGVIGAGFALPRDAGQRPALQAVPALFRNRRTAICVPLPGAVSVSRPPGLGGGAVLTLAWVGVIGAGFALPRDAGQRPALQAVPALFHNRRTAIFVPLPGALPGAVSVSRPPGLGGGAVLTLAWVGVIGAGWAPTECRACLRDWEVVRS